MDYARDRKVILFVSTIVFCATVAGVYQQNQQIKDRSESSATVEAVFPEPLQSHDTEFQAIDDNALQSGLSQNTDEPPTAKVSRAQVASSIPDNGGTVRVQPVRRFKKFSLVPPPPAAELSMEPSSFPSSADPVIVPSFNQRRRAVGTLSDNMILSAVIDNKAIFRIASLYRREHGLPSAVSLGPGEEFETVSVVTIDGKNVTVSEGMKRTVKSIAALR